jgi:predicted ester cyclase
MTAEEHKVLVRRLVEEAVNAGNLDVLDEIAQGEFAVAARRWVEPFRDSFPDFRMGIAELVADSEKVAAHPCATGPTWGEWMGHPPAGGAFKMSMRSTSSACAGGKLAAAFGVEDNIERMRQVGLST